MVLPQHRRVRDCARTKRSGTAASMADRSPTPVEGEDGMADWLAMFARFAPKDKLPKVAEKLRATHYKDGVWTVDYRRLRIVAVKVA